MKPTNVIFSHGKESGPLGRKIRRLMEVARGMGLHATSVDYRECATAADRVALLRRTIAEQQVPAEQIVLVGSSMGGYVSTVVAGEVAVAGLFLMAPALWMPAEEYTVQDYHPLTARVEITHGMADDVVPCDNSLRLARSRHGVTLHLVDDDHRLSASHDFLAAQLQRYLTLLAQQ